MISQVRANCQFEGLPLFQPRGEAKLLRMLRQELSEASQELGMGDEGRPSTLGKADLVRCLLRVTEILSDKDIDNSGFAGEQIRINC